ncbi:proton-conducting transporter transmembrane domain-containing protein [Actinomadura madurae]|uniref:proton-conducting transporter transmembrane domain-containing protein n=1 Tax=Actinomadura madurae TaxID=1993 RepID=UPI0020D25FD4|nr:proton-conducting transporter membrane subunit [Actinomadura madurae]MCP9950057.1 hydrogenase 4 subunit B [Actinomadura madurae]MCP9966818.1 hydrogenase 4 subunit B [Actinomadura madurae]MCP9979303.1 hydrogenase 4 subunit B [Actinomadura madurae]MCQ0009170.1 hydrogenase 4 subunit B [Actinomadura madurae]MCQ0015502.1 hydrogenase 4 subunit B [Actinomadura madurae]
MSAALNPVPIALAVSASCAAAGVLAAMAPRTVRARLVGTAVALSGTAGAVAGAAALAGRSWTAGWPDVLPLAGARLAADPLAGWFLLLVGAVTAAVGVYTAGYAGTGGHGTSSRGQLAVLPLFTAAMAAVPLAASVSTFLWLWELMAVASLVLVVAEHRARPSVRSAGVWYAAMTHAGFVAILIGLAWLAAACGGESFAAIRAAAPDLPEPVRAGVFLLAAAGFASKAGLVPLHPWLPKAHGEAPSHVSALMSAAMVKLGVYGLVRVGLDLLGGGPVWWWLVLGALASVSALYGILQAVLASDLKRLLAYSTCENAGLIVLGVAACGTFAALDLPALAGVALGAGLLHALNHAAFKTLLFTSAGSVVHGTGERDLDRLGGLSARMPATTGLFAAGALAAAALPPGNGFVSEWLLLQSLLGGLSGRHLVVMIAAPVAVAVVALSAGLAVATFVKALGTGFLAKPRGEAAASAREAPAPMLAGMGLAAAACAVLAVAPALTGPALERIGGTLGMGDPLDGSGTTLRLDGVEGTLGPAWVAVALAVLVAAIATGARLLGARRRAAGRAWDCGYEGLTARMEYTATSFAEPLQRVFDDVLRPEQDVDITHHVESDYLVKSVGYRRAVPDRIEAHLYRPLLRFVRACGVAARGLATGSVHRYLVYMFTALLVVLAAGVVR